MYVLAVGELLLQFVTRWPSCDFDVGVAPRKSSPSGVRHICLSSVIYSSRARLVPLIFIFQTCFVKKKRENIIWNTHLTCMRTRTYACEAVKHDFVKFLLLFTKHDSLIKKGIKCQDFVRIVSGWQTGFLGIVRVCVEIVLGETWNKKSTTDVR